MFDARVLQRNRQCRLFHQNQPNGTNEYVAFGLDLDQNIEKPSVMRNILHPPEYVEIDEMQNMSRPECRALLSRLGEGVKCICLGDINQVDNPYLN